MNATLTLLETKDNEIAKIVRCPACRGELAVDERIHCHNCGREFIRSNGIPVLIDFENSIFGPDDFKVTSKIDRDRLSGGSAFGVLLKDVTFGTENISEQNVLKFIQQLRLQCCPVVLVIGGGTIGSGADPLYKSSDISIIGTDVYASPNIKLICDGHKLPFADETFDGVLIQAVLEHVLNPIEVVEEIHRVLKPFGLVYAETPFMQQVHERAYDFSRFTLSGHRWLFRNFTEIEAGPVSGPGIALLWSIRHFVQAVSGSAKYASIVTALFFWVRFFERFAARGPALDGASGIFFMGSKSCRAVKANEMPQYYLVHRERAVE